MTRVADIGEFGLIARLARRVPAYASDVVEGIGDDVAVVRLGNGRLLLMTCDIQVAGVHFLPGVITFYQLGRKIAAINLSDIGAVGGQPRHFLVSLGLPPDTEVEDLEALYDGLREECETLEVDVLGGNISQLPVLTIDAFLVGEVEEARLLRRRGAGPGDLVAVTGKLGGSRAGLELALHPELRAGLPPAIVEAALAAHLTPRPRVREGQALAACPGVTAMIDVSDGLAADIGHICDESQVGVRLWAETLPAAESVAPIARMASADPLAWALGGGEDYELCFTVRPASVDAAALAVRAATGLAVTVIGEVLPREEGRLLRVPGAGEEALPGAGWDHFRMRKK
jgi:thiamine-monophosphate kinase